MAKAKINGSLAPGRNVMKEIEMKNGGK